LGQAINSPIPSSADRGSVVTDGTPVSLWSKKEKIQSLISGLTLIALLGTAYFLSAKENIGNAPISLLIGLSLGIIFERGRFCFFCIFRDSLEDKNNTPFLSILVAIITGSIGYAIIFGQFLPDTSQDRLPPAAHIAPVSWPLILAAFVFGIGMALSGACLSGHLYRLGQGYLRAIPALLGSLIGFGIAFITWNWLYLNSISDAPTFWLPNTFGYAGSLVITTVVILLLALLLIKKGVNSEPLRSNTSAEISLAKSYRNMITQRWSPITTGVLVGAIGMIAYLRVEPLGVTRQLSTTVRTLMDENAIGPDSLLGLDKISGCIAVISQTITNNGWLVFGLVGGSFAAAIAGGRFEFSKLTVRNTSTAFVGGILLGWGSMTALGCTIGVLLSGTQAFAISGWIFFLFVYLGVWVGTKAKLHKL
jgi:uncharacterized membrane protein YedE/YeeE